MFRRRFLQMFTVAGVGGLTGLDGVASEKLKLATYKVKGFSCITCATGLDTMLSRHKGIQSSLSTYPEGVVKVAFHPEQVTGEWITGFIAELGFTVESSAYSS